MLLKMNSIKEILPIFILSFLFSCNESQKKVVVDSTASTQKTTVDTLFDYSLLSTDTVPTKHLKIGNTGLSIDLPITHKIDEQPGNGFMVYYFTPVDTTVYHGEGGIYLGPKPDEHPPTTNYSKKIIPGTLLGVKTNWIEYTTADYTQTETFIDIGDGQKIHVWYYATNLTEMAKLLKMIRTLSR